MQTARTAAAALFVVAAVAAAAGAKSRCSEAELEQFAAEYEVCHSRALQRLQATAVATLGG